MRKTKMNKKLALNKQTISDLGKEELNSSRGGATKDPFACGTGVCVTPHTNETWCLCFTADYGC